MQELRDAASDEVSRLRHFNECFVQGLITFFKSITDDQFYPSRIEFEHKRDHGEAHVSEVLGDESIDEIVYLTGFSEPSTFYRAFKRWSGMTPIEYRKTAQGKDAMVDAM